MKTAVVEAHQHTLVAAQAQTQKFVPKQIDIAAAKLHSMPSCSRECDSGLSLPNDVLRHTSSISPCLVSLLSQRGRSGPHRAPACGALSFVLLEHDQTVQDICGGTDSTCVPLSSVHHKLQDCIFWHSCAIDSVSCSNRALYSSLRRRISSCIYVWAQNKVNAPLLASSWSS